MSKYLLYIAAFALVGFILSTRFSTPATYEPFVQTCLSGGPGTERQCKCLADFVHDRLTPEELRAIMEDRVVGKAFQDKVAEVVRSGADRCH